MGKYGKLPLSAQQQYVALPQSYSSGTGTNERTTLAFAAVTCIILPVGCSAVGLILSLGFNEASTFWSLGYGFFAVVVGIGQAAAIFRARSFVYHDCFNRPRTLRMRAVVIALAILSATAILLSLLVGIVFNLGFAVPAFGVLNFLFILLPSITAIGRLYQIDKSTRQHQDTSQLGPFYPQRF